MTKNEQEKKSSPQETPQQRASRFMTAPTPEQFLSPEERERLQQLQQPKTPESPQEK